MAGPAPSPPSKDMAVSYVTSVYLTRLHLAHSTSLTPDAETNMAARCFAVPQWGIGDGRVSIRKMSEKKIQLSQTQTHILICPPKIWENATCTLRTTVY